MSIESAPAVKYTAVTPSDSTVYDARALFIGGAGNLSLMPIGGSTAVTFTGVTAGTVLPVSAGKVMAATTATLIVALY
jgi:hypothetical protein